MSKEKPKPQASPFDNLEAMLEREINAQEKQKSRTKVRPKSLPTNMILYKDQTQWLDELCLKARQEEGIPVRRTALIRAIIDFAQTLPVDIAGVQSEEQIIERFKQAR